MLRTITLRRTSAICYSVTNYRTAWNCYWRYGVLSFLNFTERLSQALKHFLKCPVGEDGESIELAIETVRNAFFGFWFILQTIFWRNTTKITSTVPTLNYTSITKENDKGTCRPIECNYVRKNERTKQDSDCPFMFIAAAFSIFRILGWSGWWRGADTSVDWLSHGRGWRDTKGRTEPHSAVNCSVRTSFNNQPWSWTEPVEAKKRFYQP